MFSDLSFLNFSWELTTFATNFEELGNKLGFERSDVKYLKLVSELYATCSPLLPVERGAYGVEEEAVPLASLVEVVLALSIAHPPTAHDHVVNSV